LLYLRTYAEIVIYPQFVSRGRGFSSVPKLPGWSFQRRISIPTPGLRILLDKPLGHELEVEWLGAAVSPTDTSGKDSTLPLVTSENPFPL